MNFNEFPKSFRFQNFLRLNRVSLFRLFQFSFIQGFVVHRKFCCAPVSATNYHARHRRWLFKISIARRPPQPQWRSLAIMNSTKRFWPSKINWTKKKRSDMNFSFHLLLLSSAINDLSCLRTQHKSDNVSWCLQFAWKYFRGDFFVSLAQQKKITQKK